MKNRDFIFTSESVSAGHPDKICDQISDSILDAYLTEDSNSRVAVETLVTTGKVVLAGEVRSKAHIEKKQISDIARQTIKDIGYDGKDFGWQSVNIDICIHEQSSDIAQGVDFGISANSADKGESYTSVETRSTLNLGEGAGDQGIMFGYAVNETEELMPAPIHYANRLIESIYTSWREGNEPLLGPDSKSQISLKYHNNKPVGVDTIVVSNQHVEEATLEQVSECVNKHIQKILPRQWLNDDTRILVNPTGRFVTGGPDGDAGVTGRKIVVDTYGGSAPHGGGAFSGKDATKVDRSAAYAARYLAKNIVAAGICDKCLLQLGYAIGVAEPVSLFIQVDESSKFDEEKIEEAISELCDLRPRAIRQHLKLYNPIFRKTAAFGHFGRPYNSESGEFSWEQLDLAEKLKKHFSL